MLLCECSAGKHPQKSQNPLSWYRSETQRLGLLPMFTLHLLTAQQLIKGGLSQITTVKGTVWRMWKTCPRSSASRSWSLDRTQEFWMPMIQGCPKPWKAQCHPAVPAEQSAYVQMIFICATNISLKIQMFSVQDVTETSLLCITHTHTHTLCLLKYTQASPALRPKMARASISPGLPKDFCFILSQFGLDQW